MIEVEHLSKSYGLHMALDDVSFKVKKGEILGFLGPNGAGKTTTMRILAGYFPASSGRAQVAGFDIVEEPLEAKKRVGYLPESPPLYPQMRVREYLRFVGTIHGVSKNDLEGRVERVLGTCGLSDQGNRLIKHLSKGYRQRVGLAQALVHNPEVLILDEPTVGLDPKQIIEVRELIKSLGGDHTVILSTHILPEVGMTCERVVIINKGKIVAFDTPDSLTSQLTGGRRLELTVGVSPVDLSERLKRIDGVQEVLIAAQEGDYQNLTIQVEGQDEIRNLIAKEIVQSGVDLYEMQLQSVTLEKIFLELTTEEAG